MVKPSYCSATAFEFFARQLRRLETTDGLVRAATAISMHAFDDVRPLNVQRELRTYARLVNSRVRSPQPQARLAHLHAVLFDEAGFRGNTENYSSPLNSHLPAVLEGRQGLPITLALVYKSVAERVGLRVEGLAAPRHFLVRVYAGRDTLIVDPFFGGQILTDEEARSRCGILEFGADRTGLEPFPVATHRRWLNRILNNLRCHLASDNRLDDLAAMTELLDLLLRHNA